MAQGLDTANRPQSEGRHWEEENQGGDVPEQSLEVLWKLSPASVAWIHGDEDADGRAEIHILSQEVKPLFLISNGVLDAFNLHVLKEG